MCGFGRPSAFRVLKRVARGELEDVRHRIGLGERCTPGTISAVRSGRTEVGLPSSACGSDDGALTDSKAYRSPQRSK